MSEINNSESQAVIQLANISKQLLKQQRSKTRWRRFIFLLFIGVIGYGTYIVINSNTTFANLDRKDKPFIAEVVLSGVIVSGGDIDADETIELLADAFKAENSKAVILRLNSPGGSPVQSNRINNAINYLRKKYNKKLYVVMEDVCASGCYFIASAADEIYADESSIIGSIGVVMSSFGLVEAMNKLGIKRRIYTAGEHKGFLDPFTTEDKVAINHIQKKVLDKSHQNFIEVVKKGRGKKLSNNKDLFTGLVWLGKESVELGLIDYIGDSVTISNKLKIKNRIKYEAPKTILEEITQSSARVFVNIMMESNIQQQIRLSY